MYVNTVKTGVFCFYTTLCTEAPHLSKREGYWKASSLVGLAVHQSEEAALF